MPVAADALPKERVADGLAFVRRKELIGDEVNEGPRPTPAFLTKKNKLIGDGDTITDTLMNGGAEPGPLQLIRPNPAFNQNRKANIE